MLKSVLFRVSLNCLVFTLANADFNCRGKSVGYYAETLDDCRTFYVCDDHGRFINKTVKKLDEKIMLTPTDNSLLMWAIFHVFAKTQVRKNSIFALPAKTLSWEGLGVVMHYS